MFMKSNDSLHARLLLLRLGDMGFGTGENMLQDVHMDDTLFVKNPEQVSILLSAVFIDFFAGLLFALVGRKT